MKRFRFLTASQMASIAAGILGVLSTANQFWLQIAGTPGIHFPPALTGIMQIVGIAVMVFGRSASRSNSGTGQGIVGTPKEAPAGTSAVPNPPVGLLPTLAGALTTPNLLKLIAFAAQVVSEQHAGQAVEATQQIDQSKLLAAHAEIDAQKAIETQKAIDSQKAALGNTAALMPPDGSAGLAGADGPVVEG